MITFGRVEAVQEVDWTPFNVSLVYFAVMKNVSENYTLFFVGSFLSAQVNQRPKFSENQFIVTFKEEEPIGKF